MSDTPNAEHVEGHHAEASEGNLAGELEQAVALRRSRLRTRSERRMGRRPKSLKTRELHQEVKREAEPLFDWGVRHEVAARPKTRGDCEACATCDIYAKSGAPLDGRKLTCGHVAAQAVNRCRPCIRVGCRHNLFLDVKEDGHLRKNFPGVELEEMKETCALDVADRGKHSREEVGDLTNMTGQRVTTIEREARVHLRVVLGVDEDDEYDDGE